MKTFAVPFPIKLAANLAPLSSLHEQVCPVAQWAAKSAGPEHAPLGKIAGVEVNVPGILPLMVKKLLAGGGGCNPLMRVLTLRAHPDDPVTPFDLQALFTSGEHGFGLMVAKRSRDFRHLPW
jgi:hypothetical protein